LRIGLSNVDWFFIPCRATIYRNTLLYFVLTHQQETIKESSSITFHYPSMNYSFNLFAQKKLHS
ncbi:MAG: hypothetical protein LBQ66_15760, partial [Planctomycetaceae bacterium]|nr:hypothetical protein [Planctomycetaceae bacterium]